MIAICSLLDEIILFNSYKGYANPSRCKPADFAHGDHGRKFIHALGKPQAPTQFLTLVKTRHCFLENTKVTHYEKENTFRAQKYIQGSPLLGWAERMICYFGNVIREKEYHTQLQNNYFDFSTSMSNHQSKFLLVSFDRR